MKINFSTIKKIFLLGFPIIVSNLSRTLMDLVDMAMVAGINDGAKALAAVGFSGMLAWVVLSMGLSLRTSTQTIASRRLGQEKYSECSLALRNGQILALCLGVPLSVLGFYFAPEIMTLLIKQNDILSFSIEYSMYAFLAIYFTLCAFVFQGFYNAIEMTKIHMKVVLISNLINVYLNAALIYGTDNVSEFLSYYGIQNFSFLWNIVDFPKLGVMGAGIATLLSSAFMVLLYISFLFKKNIRQKYDVFNFYVNSELLKKQAYLAFPLATQELFSSIGFFLFFKILDMVGTIELATTNVIFRIAHASFMPAVGIGQAASTLVGKYIGQNREHKLNDLIFQTIYLSLFIMGTMGVLFILFPKPISSLFNVPIEIYDLGVPSLQLIGVLQFFDAIGISLWFICMGAGDIKFSAITDCTIIWLIFVPISYMLGIVYEFGYWGPWIGFSFHIILFSLVISYRIWSGKWRGIEV